jgi:hypothetical protein
LSVQHDLATRPLSPVSLAQPKTTPLEKMGSGSRKATVVALHLFISSAHAVEAPLSLLTGNLKRAKSNLQCAKIALFCLNTFTVPKEHILSSRFDFHHISYGLLFMLLPGRFEQFGKYITTCSLVNYDHVGVFCHNKQKKFFTQDPDGKFSLKDPISRGSDGTLEQISGITVEDGSKRISEKAFPADNYFVRHWKKLVGEMFTFWKPAPYLTAATQKKNEIIEQVVKPELAKIKSDPSRYQMPISVNFDLFK